MTNSEGQLGGTSAADMRITLSHVTKSFGDARVLRDVDFDDEVSTLAIIGPSGSGKSTLLRIMGGLIEPTGGTVCVNGEPVVFDERTLPAYRAGLGFVFQQGGLFHHLCARENVTLPLVQVHGMSQEAADKRALELLDRLGLSSDAEKRPSQLSGGQRQRVAIARAVAARPRLLLLDEPTSALDPEYTNEVLDVIDDLRRDGARFVIVTHEMGFARHACDKVAFLDEGSILEYGESASVFSAPKTPQLSRFLSKLLEWNV